jgi:hypothetical protein
MSSQERTEKAIEENKKLVEEIDKDIEQVSNELKDESLSEEKKKELEEKLQKLQDERIDILADVGMLQELLNKHNIQDTACGYRCDGKCQTCLSHESEGYDAWNEVFTAGDY